MSGGDYVDPNPQYWQDYTNLQHVKHALIREYLNGWFPKLGLWARRILYVDTHAGRGRHETGELGSPLVALTTFLEHRSRDAILDRSDIAFIFIERDGENAAALQNELVAARERLDALEERRSRVRVEVHPGECEQILSAALEYLHSRKQRTAPSFVFVDPYGFKVPCRLLRDLMSFERVELFVNIMWRHLYMGIRNAATYPSWHHTLAWVLDDAGWAGEITSQDFDTCADQVLSFLQRKLQARWLTSVRMLGSNNATEYILAHFTNHDDGRDLMKTVMWKVCPSCDGAFVARKGDDPTQGVLLRPDPDLRPLEHWVRATLRRSPTRWQTLQEMVREQSWRVTHVNNVVKALRRAEAIIASDYQGRFAPTSNPLLSLSPEEGVGPPAQADSENR